jgi:ribosomal-protein-alanine N-acetyltransferase
MVSAAPAFTARRASGRAPTAIETDRLLLRRPVAADAAAVFARYGADPAATRFLGWRTQRSITDAQTFIAFCDVEWEQRGVGPYLIYAREGGRLLGSAELGMESPRQAVVGYVLASDAWGKGYATEALSALRDLAAQLGVLRLYAMCHFDNRASWRVMEKCGFRREAILRGRANFPNLQPGLAADVLCYSMFFDASPHSW